MKTLMKNQTQQFKLMKFDKDSIITICSPRYKEQENRTYMTDTLLQYIQMGDVQHLNYMLTMRKLLTNMANLIKQGFIIIDGVIMGVAMRKMMIGMI
jgi:hypothetical protein